MPQHGDASRLLCSERSGSSDATHSSPPACTGVYLTSVEGLSCVLREARRQDVERPTVLCTSSAEGEQR